MALDNKYSRLIQFNFYFFKLESRKFNSDSIKLDKLDKYLNICFLSLIQLKLSIFYFSYVWIRYTLFVHF